MKLDYQNHRQHVDHIVQAVLEAIDPASAVKRNLRREGRSLLVGRAKFDLGHGRLFIVGAGKASLRMGEAAAEVLGDTVSAGIVIGKRNADTLQKATTGKHSVRGGIVVYEAGHPIPDESSVSSTAAILELLEETGEEDIVLCLISGGASSLLTQPRIPLAAWQQLVDNLLASGCTINELNTVRRRLDSVKGGGLANKAAPATCISLILSDVVGNALEAIGSGPTVANPDSPDDARLVLSRYDMSRKLEPQIWQTIESQLHKVDTSFTAAAWTAHNYIIGDVRLAAEAATSAAERLGFTARLLTSHLQGEAREVGRVAASLAKDAGRGECLVLAGETTVTLRGEGLGGRNQELALAAAVDLDSWQDSVVATLATDGDDGPTGAAGAIATGQTASQARTQNLNPRDFLDRNDSNSFFKQTGGLLVTGQTGTNVNDLVIILKY